MNCGRFPSTDLNAAKSASEASARAVAEPSEKSAENSPSNAASREFLRRISTAIFGPFCALPADIFADISSRPKSGDSAEIFASAAPDTGFRPFSILRFATESSAETLEPSGARTAASAFRLPRVNPHSESVCRADGEFSFPPSGARFAVGWFCAAACAGFRISCAGAFPAFPAASFTSSPSICADSMSAFLESSPAREYFIFADFREISAPSGRKSRRPSASAPPSPARTD